MQELLRVVIDHYVDKGDPIWSKFLNSLDDISYAPSTLRKYLNILEKEWLLYQPYNSSWRVPTVKWLSNYMDDLLDKSNNDEFDEVEFDIKYARNDLRWVVETLWDYVDGAAVWFLKEDEYFYLWINNLLNESIIGDVESTKYLIKFIESRELVQTLAKKMIKKWQVYYTILENDDKLISILYVKLEVNWFDAIISILWPSRVDHKKNIMILRKVIWL